ncbi:Pre-mRNA-processing factor 19 [Diplonema papillatum]|nr:Pre-mRNA-processing factor 19 [Diplonema papillatum]WGM49982.1 PRP19 [Diplonema papillatum]
MQCAISGQVPERPVVSVKNGILFEKRLVEELLRENGGKCPVTGIDLGKEDLVEIDATRAPQLRPASLQSIPGLLAAQQQEWDAVMLENFQLKKQLDAVRQELSHSLYQHDAACRVIARLMTERDQALAAAEKFKAKTSDKDPYSPEVLELIEKAREMLRDQRKNRPMSATLAKVEQLAKMQEKWSRAPHSTTAPGVLCLAKKDQLLATGGVDGSVVLLDEAAGEVQQKLSVAKAVRTVLFAKNGKQLFTGGDDCVVRTWAPAADKTYGLVSEFKDYRKPVRGLDISPSYDHLLTCSAESIAHIYDYRENKRLVSITPNVQSSFTSCQYHPDGLLVAVGTETAGSHSTFIWTGNDGKCTPLATKEEKPVTSLSFSENGYWLATGSVDGTVRVWDLRKKQKVASLTFADSDPTRPTPCNKVLFDYSGVYLAICTDSIKIYETKTWTEVTCLRAHSAAVTDCVWGRDASSLHSTSMDRQIKKFTI